MNSLVSAQIREIPNLAALDQLSRVFSRTEFNSYRFIRPDAEPGAALVWPDKTALDLVQRFGNLQEEFDLPHPSRGPIAFHSVMRLPPEWISKTGDLFDPENSRNNDLLRSSLGCIRGWAGAERILCCRVSLDEPVGGVADVVMTPIRRGRGNRWRTAVEPLSNRS